MNIYILAHTINSQKSKRKLENYLSGLVHILNFEEDKGYCTFEFQANTRKKDLIQLLGSFVNGLSLNENERVVLYDTRIWSKPFEKPRKSEKIILNGNLVVEDKIEEIIIDIFKHVHFKMTLEDVSEKYFNS